MTDISSVGLSTAEQLARFLKLQDEALQERLDILFQRSEILRLADEAGREDLDADEDERFRSLTRALAVVDDGLEQRDHDIQRLADLCRLQPPLIKSDEELDSRIAAAEIFQSWRGANSGPRGRTLTVAQARGVVSFDT